MIKIVTALVSTVLGLALLLSFKTQSASAPRSALEGAGSNAPSETGTGSDGETMTTTKKSAPRTARPKESAKPASKSGTFDGNTIDTPFGPIQVAAVIHNGTLTDITVLQETYGGRSQQIDDAAIPILKSQALSKHSANIDVVSGATYTSQGYAQSLQSALDKAGI